MLPEYTPATLERFWSKVDRRGPDGCWVWTAGRYAPNKYGKFWAGYGYLGAHVFSWTLHFGPVPPGLCVLHNCPTGDNVLCVNPGHLWVGTKGQNCQDRAAKGRSCRGAVHPKSRLSAEQVIEIRAAAADGSTAMDLAPQYGVSTTAIRLIVKRVNWAHLA